VPGQRRLLAFVSFSVIAFSFAAIAADDSLPRNIELKPGGAPADDAAGQTAEDTSSGTTTRQIVTEPANAAPPPPPGGAPSPGAAPPGKVQTELKRVGCDPGVADVVWGGHFAKVNVGNHAPTPEFSVSSKPKRPSHAAPAEGAGPPPAVHQTEPVPLHEQRYGGGYGGGGGGGY
jgi:hypothetical protein